MPSIYGGIAAITIMFLAIKNFRTNDWSIFIIFGLIAGITAYYANWVWFVHDIYDDFIMSPGDLWDRIKFIQMERSIDINVFIHLKKRMLTIKDGWLAFAWLLEFIMIFGGVAAGFFYALTETYFFCSSCKHWYEATPKPYKLASDKPEYELTSLEAIMEMERPTDENNDHYTVTVFECPYCKNGTFSLTAQKAVLKDGKYEFKKKTLLNRIQCPADKVVELKEFVTATGIECEK